MRWGAMPSSVIRRFAWRRQEQALDIEFVTGRIYRYRGVPEEVAQGMRRVLSKGGYFNRAIRDHYPCDRLSFWPADGPSPELAWRSD